jgi:chemotaxis methyl-accepting protein methylase
VPGGYLLIGHSESLNGLKVPFQCLKPSVYRLI